MTLLPVALRLAVLALPLLPAASIADAEVVVVASRFRVQELATVPLSLTVLDAATIRETAVQHFEELIPQVPNLNWSGEGSRARYFQIRGTGELEQYEGAPNPSVGFIVDDIDVSGLGGLATTFDLDRVEVLRGPQGTRFGASALAGLVYVSSNAPSAVPELRFTTTVGTENTLSLGGVAGGAVPGSGEELTWRVAVQRHASDGFRRNVFLGRDDTSERDELTARGRLHWSPEGPLDLQLTLLHADLDNGYDDFAVDNSFRTQSNQPGRDAQRSTAGAVRATLALGGTAELVSITGLATTDVLTSFDADWGNDAFWAPFVYAFSQRFDRQRDTINQELRLVSAPGGRILGSDWVIGAWYLDLSESNHRRDVGLCGVETCGGSEDFVLDVTASSDYHARSFALFGEVSRPVGPATTLTGGLRWETRSADYTDNFDNAFTPRDRMVGGDLTLTRRLGPATSAWARVARGYKAGGFNPSLAGLVDAGPDSCAPGDDLAVTPAQLDFEPESLWNYEVGLRLAPAAARWSSAVSVFTQDRQDLQIKVPVQPCPGDPTTFVFLTDNADTGRTRGLELAATWQPLAPLTLGASLGLLDTEIERFATRPELAGRELAHAPRYNFGVNGTWRTPDGWFVRADYSGRGRFYVDYCQAADCEDPRTGDFRLLDLRAGRAWGNWSVTGWVRNLLDESYAVRGFFFGNEPPDFDSTLYVRRGDPRHAGLTIAVDF